MLKSRPHFDQFERPPLKPWNREGWTCLDKNEAPFSPLTEASEFYESLKGIDARTYPDPFPLYEKLSRFVDLSTDHLLLTFGSEQAIRYAYELMISPGDQVVCLSPSFAMLEVFNKTFQAEVISVEFHSVTLPLGRILGAITDRTRLVVLPNPNNPTGSILSLKDLAQIAEKCHSMGAMLLSDEAYFHYSSVTAQPLVRTYDNVVVTRTFSKGWGLAGIRVGYLIAQKETVNKFRKLKPIDEVSVFSLQAGLFALENQGLLKKNVEQVQKWQKKFSSLNSPSAQYVESFANFILLKVPEARIPILANWFQDQRILVKTDLGHPALKNHIRFSVTADAVMERIFDFCSTN